MTEPNTFWLTVTNIVLGAAVVLCCLFLAALVFCEIVSRRDRHKSLEAEVSHDFEEMFGVPRAGAAGLRVAPAATAAPARIRLCARLCACVRRVRARITGLFRRKATGE